MNITISNNKDPVKFRHDIREKHREICYVWEADKPLHTTLCENVPAPTDLVQRRWWMAGFGSDICLVLKSLLKTVAIPPPRPDVRGEFK